MSKAVFIAGVGAITAIGNTIPECLSALEKEEAGMGAITYLETVHRNSIPVAEVTYCDSVMANGKP